MLTKQCAKCRKIIPYGTTYCEACQTVVDEHKQQSRAMRTKQYDKTRNAEYKAFYNSKDWRTLRLVKLQQSGYKCECCGEIAEDVHHIIPIDTPEGWARRLDITNLMCLCVRCHNKQHKRFCKG